MAKERKTRKQKELADTRRQALIQQRATYSFTHTLPTVLDSQKNAPTTSTQPIAYHVSTSSYQYLSSDLFKTIILTGSIVFVELLLRFLMRS